MVFYCTHLFYIMMVLRRTYSRYYDYTFFVRNNTFTKVISIKTLIFDLFYSMFFFCKSIYRKMIGTYIIMNITKITLIFWILMFVYYNTIQIVLLLLFIYCCQPFNINIVSIYILWRFLLIYYHLSLLFIII